MKTFELNDEALQKGWGDEGQYWFSLKDYVVKDIADSAYLDRPEDISEDDFLLSIGYIPYFKVRRIELAKAYIEAVGSSKLKDTFSKIPDSECIETFWKYYNAYPTLAAGYEDFQNAYLIGKAVDWCDSNGINYKIK